MIKNLPMLSKYSIISILSCILLLIGCSSKSPNYRSSSPGQAGIHMGDSNSMSDIQFVDDENYRPYEEEFEEEEVQSSFYLSNPHLQVWQSYYYFENVLSDFPSVVPMTESEIPVVLNDKVHHYINFFQTNGRNFFAKWLSRSGKYIPMMTEILEDQGMPKDLVYQAMIESGFSVSARSHAGAVGPWQFIKPTAKRYGLRVDTWTDERMDPRKATIAASNYMRDLYEMFQSWELAAAGYNCGEDRVQNAIDKYQLYDFWQISEHTLPRETKNYVPKMMAALIIAKNPAQYGFTGINYQSPLRFETAEVAGQKKLSDIAKVIGVSPTKLKELNPALLQKATPPGGSYQINVPIGYARVVSNKSTQIAKLPKASPVHAKNSKYAKHKVRRGDTLAKISSRYGVKMSSIKRANGLKGSKVMLGQTLTIPGVSSKSTTSSSKNRTTTVKYKVRRGDTLGAIAARHRVSASSIKRANGIKGSLIKSGQTITIPGASGRYYDDVGGSVRPTISKYRVKSGDTLGGIAAKHRVSITTIKRTNGISGSTIRTGQVLKIPHVGGTTYASSKTSTKQTRSTIKYKVKRGDTLGGVAARHRVKIATIKSTNNLKSNNIMVGQTLTIPGSSYKASSSTSKRSGQTVKYKVKRGDTLGGVAARHKVKIATIKNANNLKSNNIMVGQTLTIPGSSYVASSSTAKGSKPTKYKVKRGDTLGGIAARHNVKLASIKSANNISGSNIRVGQVISIPSGQNGHRSAKASTVRYNVKKGDTLWEIASKHNVTVANIKKWNKLTSNSLAPGKKLTIYR